GAGVGPYEVERFTPGEELVLRARDDYWGGPVCLATVRFVAAPDAAAALEALRAGELDAAFLGAPGAAADAEADGLPGHRWPYGGLGFLLNGGRGESPMLADVRLRRAVVHALDLEA